MSKCYDIPKVIICVRGGVAEVLEKPDEIEVIIQDYDCDNTPSPHLKKDSNGDLYIEGNYPAE